MSYTIVDYNNLKKAIATGAKRVRFGAGDHAHETEFRSLAEMKQVLADIEAELFPASVPTRTSFVAFSRG
ncbi:MAG TPA: hypothetical protein VNZ94_01795 [Xanthobacteraceae bacterium]|nr:hypothetical protein [Xanthobacteraceae bacterium]